MQPLAVGGQLIGFGWETRRDEPGREGTLQHDALSKVGQGQLQLRPDQPAFFDRMVLAMTGRPPAGRGKPWPVVTEAAGRGAYCGSDRVNGH